MVKRVVVLAVVLLLLGAIGYFFGLGQALACGFAAVVVYVYAMYKRFSGNRPPER
jgi:hypothetical protein